MKQRADTRIRLANNVRYFPSKLGGLRSPRLNLWDISVIKRVRLVATVENLERLIASGRVPGVAALANRWLGMNPLFEFREGRARPLRPAFSRDAALDRIVASWRQSIEPGGRLHVAALHAEAEEDAKRILKQVTTEVTAATAFVAPFSSVMVAHTGLGLVGLGWYWDS